VRESCVSLLTSFFKIFEKVIYNRLLVHTKENNIIVTDQYGFKNNSSTELAIFKLTNQILSHMNNKSLVCGIFCDLTKAFDTVNREILISKLEYCGVIGRTNKLIKSYLSNRYQRVTIKTSQASNYTSAWELVKHGVPQGSILGPLPFLFYINDLPQLVKDIALLVLFADDMNFLIANSNLMNMNQDLKLVLGITQEWFKSNIMLLNYDKTTFMQFSANIGHRSTASTQTIDQKINFTNSIKFLGIIIESSLTCNKHIDCINSKLNSLGYILRSLRSVLSLEIIKQIYFSYVQSVINYGIIF